MIVELKTRVQVLDKELRLVNANANKEMVDLRRQKERLTGEMRANEDDKKENEQSEVTNVGSALRMLKRSKEELEEASTQIGHLKKELKIQQDYYEGQLMKEKQAGGGNETTNKTKYDLTNALEVSKREMIQLDRRLAEAVAERAASEQMVKTLQEELKLQSAHFQKETKNQALYHAKLAEKQLNDDNKIQELLTQLSKEQMEVHRLKSTHTASVKEASEIGYDKVQMLQEELAKQNEFFRVQERGYREEIEALKIEIKRGSVLVHDKHEQIDQIVSLAADMKKANQKMRQDHENL